MSDDDNVLDMRMRRAQQLKNTSSEDPVFQAADAITYLYAELATKLSAKDLYTAIEVARKSINAMLIVAVGDGHAAEIKEQADEAAKRYVVEVPRHYKGPTVFDKDKE
jgi:hypothetical protein